jgi:integral membrane sensor domain MASE1
VLLAGVYVAAGKAAFALAFVHTSIAPVWPPSGIALAAVLLWGRRAVPGVLLGAFLFNASRRCRCGSAPSGVVNCS